MTEKRYDSSTVGAPRDGTNISERPNDVAAESSVEVADTSGMNTDPDRSRAHLRERNRLLRQRVDEQAAQIEVLEAALERQSGEESNSESSAESPSVDDSEAGISVRQRVQRWLTREPSEE